MTEPVDPELPNAIDPVARGVARTAPRRRFQFTLRTLLAAMVVMALCCGGPIQFIRWIDPRGPVMRQNEWPHELTLLIQQADGAKTEIKPGAVYCMDNKMWDDEHFWTMDASPEVLNLITKRWRLSASNRDDPWVDAFWARMPVGWYPCDELENGQYLISATRIPVTETYRAVVLYDKDRQTLVVWYEYVF